MFRAVALVVLLSGAASGQVVPKEPPAAEPVTIEYLEKAKADFLAGQGTDSIAMFRRLNADPAATEKAAIAILSRDAAVERQPGLSDPQMRLLIFYSPLIAALGRTGHESAVPVLVNCMQSRNASIRSTSLSCAQAMIELSDRVEIRKEQVEPLLTSNDPELAKLADQMWWKCIRYEGLQEDPTGLLANYRQTLTNLEKQLGKPEDWKKVAETRGIKIPATNPGPAIREFIKSCEAERQRLTTARRADKTPFDPEAFARERYARLYVELQAMEALAACGLDESFDCFVEFLAAGGDGIMGREGPVQWAAVYHLHRMTGQYFPTRGTLTQLNRPMPVDLSKKAAAAWRKWRTQAGKDVRKPDPAALVREDRLAAFRIDQARGGTAGEFTRPTDDVVDELLREGNRAILEMLVAVLRTKTLTEAQVAKLIPAAEKEASPAKRLYLWQVLFDAQSSAAAKFLEKVFQAAAEEGQVAQFVGSIRTVRPGDVPLLTHIYANSTSPVVQDAIIDFACRLGSTEEDMRLEMQRTPADRDTLRNTRIALLRWLVRNGRSDDQKLRALSGLYPGRDSVGVGRNAASEVVTEFLDAARSPDIRRRVYEMVMSKYGGEWWLTPLFSNENEETQHAALIAFRGYVEKEKAFSGYANQPAVPLLKDALSRDLPPKVRQDIEGILTMIRRAAVNATIASYQTRATQAWDPRHGRQFLEQMAGSLDRDMPIDREIGHLKAQFGSLPEEAELRATLEKLRDQRREYLRKLIDQASTQAAEPPSPARQ